MPACWRRSARERGIDRAAGSVYRAVFATEAGTPNQAVAKVRSIAEGRRLRAYLVTGGYRDELAEARWVA